MTVKWKSVVMFVKKYFLSDYNFRGKKLSVNWWLQWNCSAAVTKSFGGVKPLEHMITLFEKCCWDDLCPLVNSLVIFFNLSIFWIIKHLVLCNSCHFIWTNFYHKQVLYSQILRSRVLLLLKCWSLSGKLDSNSHSPNLKANIDEHLDLSVVVLLSSSLFWHKRVFCWKKSLS